MRRGKLCPVFLKHWGYWLVMLLLVDTVVLYLALHMFYYDQFKRLSLKTQIVFHWIIIYSQIIYSQHPYPMP